MFYCYILLDPTKPGTHTYENLTFDFEPFYVGKGKGSRIDSHDKVKDTKTHKRAKIQKIKKSGLEVIKIKLFENLSESAAFDLEKSIISLIGRKDKNEGPLLNLTNGGEGSSGTLHSIETKEKRSISIKNWWSLLKEDKERIELRNKNLSHSVSTSQKGVSYEERHKDRADEMKQKRSDWAKENFHKTGLGQMRFDGKNNPMFGKSMYDVWVEKYGIDEAERRHIQWKSKKSGKIPHNKSIDKIAQKDKDGNLIKVWEGYPEGFSKPNVCKVLKGERKFAHGFIWEYVR
jgi:hypothetical protein